MNRPWRAMLLCVLALHPIRSDPGDAPPIEDIVNRMQVADLARKKKFTGYSALREYAVENGRFGVRASMKVELTVDPNGAKQFKVLRVDGPPAIRKLVFQRMLDA